MHTNRLRCNAFIPHKRDDFTRKTSVYTHHVIHVPEYWEEPIISDEQLKWYEIKGEDWK